MLLFLPQDSRNRRFAESSDSEGRAQKAGAADGAEAETVSGYSERETAATTAGEGGEREGDQKKGWWKEGRGWGNWEKRMKGEIFFVRRKKRKGEKSN